jgi:tRNA G37 N-methylase Trm5
MTHRVNDDYRKNELSFIEGGTSLTIHHQNGKKLTYDKNKNPEAYARKAMQDPTVTQIWQADTLIWERGE